MCVYKNYFFKNHIVVAIDTGLVTRTIWSQGGGGGEMHPEAFCPAAQNTVGAQII